MTGDNVKLTRDMKLLSRRLDGIIKNMPKGSEALLNKRILIVARKGKLWAVGGRGRCESQK